MVNLGNPDLAFRTALLPSDGVGLARMEFIISESIKAHPMALVHPERVTDPDARAALARLTDGYADGETYFVERLAEGVGTIAAAFYPRRSSSACPTSRPTSTPACSAGPTSSRTRRTR